MNIIQQKGAICYRVKNLATLASRIVCLPIMLWALTSVCHSEGLESAKLKFDVLLEKAGAPEKQLVEFYWKSLDRLMDEVRKDGDPDALLQIKSEIQRLEKPDGKALPDAFQALAKQRKIYEKKAAELKVTAGKEKRSLMKKYRSAVAKYQSDYT